MLVRLFTESVVFLFPPAALFWAPHGTSIWICPPPSAPCHVLSSDLQGHSSPSPSLYFSLNIPKANAASLVFLLDMDQQCCSQIFISAALSPSTTLSNSFIVYSLFLCICHSSACLPTLFLRWPLTLWHLVPTTKSFILPCFALHSYRLGMAWDNAWDSAGPFMALGWSRMPLLLRCPSDVCWHEGWCSLVFPTENESHWGPGQHFVLGRARKCLINAMFLITQVMIKASPTLASCALVIVRKCYSVLRELHWSVQLNRFRLTGWRQWWNQSYGLLNIAIKLSCNDHKIFVVPFNLKN